MAARDHGRMATTTRSDEDRLRLFADQVERLINRRAVRDGTLKASMNMKFGPDGGGITLDTGDEEDVRSLLLDFRTFFLQKEDVNFNRISNLLARYLTDAELIDANKQNKDQWKWVTQSGGVRLIHNEEIFTPERCFDLVIYGEMFHLDAAKAAEFAGLPSFFQQMARVRVNDMVISCLRVLHAQRNLINEAFSRGALNLPL